MGMTRGHLFRGNSSTGSKWGFVTGGPFEILAKRGDDPVLVRKGSVMAATLHPELWYDYPRARRVSQAGERTAQLNLMIGTPC